MNKSAFTREEFETFKAAYEAVNNLEIDYTKHGFFKAAYEAVNIACCAHCSCAFFKAAYEAVNALKKAKD